ncbi:MAG: hypothetical protein OXN83_00085, partial [Oligoflexia bacterium]|nr:hypothetical protein [Oligoflexia bacterium]
MKNSKGKLSNSWQKTLYGSCFARLQLNSSFRHKQAREEVKFLIRELEIHKGQSILDIPCGSGRHA